MNDDEGEKATERKNSNSDLISNIKKITKKKCERGINELILIKKKEIECC